jgi:hypothetical protein
MAWRSRVAYREVRVNEVKEVLRCWLDGAGLRTAGERAGVDRKTARRYVEAAVAAGLVRDGAVQALAASAHRVAPADPAAASQARSRSLLEPAARVRAAL